MSARSSRYAVFLLSHIARIAQAYVIQNYSALDQHCTHHLVHVACPTPSYSIIASIQQSKAIVAIVIVLLFRRR